MILKSWVIRGLSIAVGFLIAVFGLNNQVMAAGKFYFEPSEVEVEVGEEFAVKIMVDTGNDDTGGAGVKIFYDPGFIRVLEVVPGKIYGDYPLAGYDNISGLVSVSGVASSKETMFRGQGEFAYLKAKATAPGEEQMSFDFRPGRTDDSNIAVLYGIGDNLSSVNNLEVKINPKPAGTNQTETEEEGQEDNKSVTKPKTSLVDKTLSIIGLKKDTPQSTDQETEVVGEEGEVWEEGEEIDPYAPLQQQKPIERVFRTQEEVSGTAAEAGGVIKWVARLAGLVILGVLVAVVWRYKLWERMKTKIKHRKKIVI